LGKRSRFQKKPPTTKSALRGVSALTAVVKKMTTRPFLSRSVGSPKLRTSTG
jgi:hypothetical protein